MNKSVPPLAGQRAIFKVSVTKQGVRSTPDERDNFPSSHQYPTFGMGRNLAQSRCICLKLLSIRFAHFCVLMLGNVHHNGSVGTRAARPAWLNDAGSDGRRNTCMEFTRGSLEA
jgi:hypothetical protein